LGIPFTYKNSSVLPKRPTANPLGDLARRAVVVTDFINSV